MDQLFIYASVRPLLMAAATAAALTLFRIHKPSIQHAAWTVVMLSMLMVPVWTIFGIQANLPILPPVATTAGPVATVASSPAPGKSVMPAGKESADAATATQKDQRPNWEVLLFSVYLFGVLVFLIRLAIGTLLTAKFIHGAKIHDGQLTSSVCSSPATVGVMHPVVILPASWTQWPPKQLEAVLLHEREHARRRDPLILWLAMLNRALFWFHPLAWWLQQRLAALAEDCCDDAVLAGGHDAHDYSTYLLDLARSVTNAGSRLLSVGMAAPGDRLLKRVRRICGSSAGAPSSRIKVGLAIASCALFCFVFSGVELAHSTAPRPRQQISFGDRPAAVALPLGQSEPATRPIKSVAPALATVRPESSGTAGPTSEPPESSASAEAQTSQVAQPKVAGIQVNGNRKISFEVIRSHIHLAVGDILNPDTVMNDVRSLYATGEFDDIRISTEAQGANSVILIFTVKEKPPQGPEAQQSAGLTNLPDVAKELEGIVAQHGGTVVPLPMIVLVDFIGKSGEATIVSIKMTVRYEDLGFEMNGGFHKTDSVVVGRIIDKKTGHVASTFEESLTQSIPDDLFPSVLPTTVTYPRQVLLRTGTYELMMAVKNLNTGKVGVINKEVTVP